MLSNPIEVSDIFAVDGRERSGVFFHGVEAFCPGIYSVYNCVIDSSRSMSTAGTFSLRSERPIAGRRHRAPPWHIVHVDADATDRKGVAFVIACGFDQNAAELASSRDQVVGPFEANLVCKTLLFERLEHR